MSIRLSTTSAYLTEQELARLTPNARYLACMNRIAINKRVNSMPCAMGAILKTLALLACFVLASYVANH